MKKPPSSSAPATTTAAGMPKSSSTRWPGRWLHRGGKGRACADPWWPQRQPVSPPGRLPPARSSEGQGGSVRPILSPLGAGRRAVAGLRACDAAGFGGREAEENLAGLDRQEGKAGAALDNQFFANLQ